MDFFEIQNSGIYGGSVGDSDDSGSPVLFHIEGFGGQSAGIQVLLQLWKYKDVCWGQITGVGGMGEHLDALGGHPVQVCTLPLFFSGDRSFGTQCSDFFTRPRVLARIRLMVILNAPVAWAIAETNKRR